MYRDPRALANILKKPPLELALHLAEMQSHENPSGVRTKSGKTLLHIAARHSLTEAIQVLVAAGADLNAQCNRGETPLMTACSFLQEPAARLLLDYGADGDKTDNEGWSPLMIACDRYTEASHSLVDLLLRWGVNKHHTSNDNWKARSLAECIKDKYVRDKLLVQLQ